MASRAPHGPSLRACLKLTHIVGQAGQPKQTNFRDSAGFDARRSQFRVRARVHAGWGQRSSPLRYPFTRPYFFPKKGGGGGVRPMLVVPAAPSARRSLSSIAQVGTEQAPSRGAAR